MKKKLPSLPLPSHSKKLASILLIATAAAAQASLFVGESFVGYIDGAELGGTTNQAATGLGLTGAWTGSGFFKSQDAGLSMTGVASSGGSAFLLNPGNSGKQADVAFDGSVLLSSGTFYGSYLFKVTHDGTTGRPVGAIGIGSDNLSDNSAAFTWAGDGFNSADPTEGPGIRAQGSSWAPPFISLTSGETYVYLFQFDVVSGTTTGWVLNQAQLTNFHGSLDATTLDAATPFTTDATGVFWVGAATNTITAGTSHLGLFGLGTGTSEDPVYNFEFDEIRISDSSLFEAVAVPEPSTLATLVLALGSGAVGCVLRRRRKA